jgi:hypothetical protein
MKTHWAVPGKTLQEIIGNFNPWREIALGMVILLEVSWLLPWYFLLSGILPDSSLIRIGMVLTGILLLCILIVHWLSAIKISYVWRIGILALLLLFVIIMGGWFVFGEKIFLYISYIVHWSAKPDNQSAHLPQAFVLLLLIFLAFWRGMVLSQGMVNPEMVRGTLALAIGMDSLAILYHAANPEMNLIGFLLFMVFTGITAMSTARLSSLSVLRGRQQLVFRASWLAGILLATLVVVVFSYSLALAVKDHVDWIILVVQIPILIITILAVILILPFLWLFSWILEVTGSPTQILNFIYDSILRLSNLVEAMVKMLSDWFVKSGAASFLALVLPYARAILLWGFLLGIAGGLIWWAALSLARVIEHRKGIVPLRQVDEEFSASLWERIQRHIIQARHLISRWQLPGSGGGGRAGARIRRIFADLLRLSKDLGYPRPEGNTPLEFLPTLRMIFINLENELQQITEAYLLVRYGQFDENLLDLKQVEAAWKKVEALGQAELTRKKLINS